MSWFKRWRFWRWSTRDADMAEEIRLHLDQRIDEHVAEGLSPDEARHHALRSFGGVEQVKTLAREQRSSAGLEALVRDVRHGIRSLAHAPLFTAVALLTLALGLGANTAMFSLVDTLLLQPAPYPDSDQLVRIHRTVAQSNALPHSLPDYRDLRDFNRSFTSLTAYQFWAYSLAEPGQPAEHITGVTATVDIFTTLGVQPSLGRSFTADEQQPGRDRVVVLSNDWWQRQFGGDPQIVGRSVRLDGENVTIIGVMPARAAYPLFWGRVDVWRPLRLSNDWRERRDVRWLSVIGRLRPGIPFERAQAELDTIAQRLARQYPDSDAGSGLRIMPLHASVMEGTQRQVTWFTFGLAGFVLLIACANLSSLQLARAAANARQFALRVALGAPRRALIRQSLIENMLLAITGGGLGLATAMWIARLIAARIPLGTGHLVVSLDGRAVIFALLASLGSGLLFGVMPAWVVSRTDVNDILKQQARGSTGDRATHRLRHALLVFEIALTLVLLGGAAEFLSGLRDFARRDLGWRTAGLLTGTVTVPENRYASTVQLRAFHERLLRRIKLLPGVEQAALSSAVPINAAANAPLPVYIEGRPLDAGHNEPLAHYAVVSPHFFATIGATLVRGRFIPDDIRPSTPGVAVINETMAHTLWPGEDPIGKRISAVKGGPWNEIIGVVRDTEFAADLGAPTTNLQVYESLVRDPWGYVTLLLRATSPETLAEPLRHAVAEIDPDLPVDQLRTVAQAVDDSQHFYRLANGVLAGFAVLGLLLSAIGLYGVIAGIVVRRTPEFGIRLALGARPADVLWCVLSLGLKLSVLGVAIGFVGAVALSRVLGVLAPSLPTQDPGVIGAVALLLVAVATLACWIPARRATKLDPVIALRAE